MATELPGAHGLNECLNTLQAAFPELVVTSVLPIDEGWANYVLEINESLIFRFPRREEISPKVATELRFLPALSKVLPLPIPAYTYVAVNPGADTPRFVGYSKIPGQAMFLHQSSPSVRRKVANQLGKFISALHRFSTTRAVESGVLKESSDTWQQEYEYRYSQVRRLVLPLLKLQRQANLERAWESFLKVPSNFAFTPVFVHRDLGGDNVLWDPPNGMITGVIDWEAASLGDPAIDFANEFNIDPAEQALFRDMLLSAYDGIVDDGFRARVEFYSREWPIHAVLFGLETDQQDLVSSGLLALEDLYSDAG